MRRLIHATMIIALATILFVSTAGQENPCLDFGIEVRQLNQSLMLRIDE